MNARVRIYSWQLSIDNYLVIVILIINLGN